MLLLLIFVFNNSSNCVSKKRTQKKNRLTFCAYITRQWKTLSAKPPNWWMKYFLSRKHSTADTYVMKCMTTMLIYSFQFIRVSLGLWASWRKEKEILENTYHIYNSQLFFLIVHETTSKAKTKLHCLVFTLEESS